MLPEFLDKESKKYLFKYSFLDFKNIQMKKRISHLKIWIKEQLLLKNKSKISGLLRNYSQPNLVNPLNLLEARKELEDITAKPVKQTTNLKQMIKRSAARRLSLFSTTKLLANVPSDLFQASNNENVIKSAFEEYKYPKM